MNSPSDISADQTVDTAEHRDISCWWPDLLRYISDDDPWANPNVLVAELKSYEDDWTPGDRILWSALVPLDVMEKIGPNLAGFGHEPEANGPHPSATVAGTYNPAFMVRYYSEALGHIDCEAFVLSWQANDQTTMMLNPGFAMTYGLMPRLSSGRVYWDDAATPQPGIAVVDAVSTYKDMRVTPTRAVVTRDHLQDYLTLRGMALVQVYYEKRSGPSDKAAEALMSGDYLDLELPDRHIDVRRVDGGTIMAQVWGARVIAWPGELPVSTDPLETEGLLWPLREKPLNRLQARHLRPWEGKAYIRDEVLSLYYNDDAFHIDPISGSMSFGNQWGVGDCRRVGRDLIELDLRSLYSGARPSVVRRWHQFATNPPENIGQSTVSANDLNVGKRAAGIVEAMLSLGEALRDLAQELGISISARDLIGFSPRKVHYEGWWTQPFLKQISRPFPPDLGRDAFLSRCLELDKVVNEALGSAGLRKIVSACGPQPDTKNFGSLKLLDRILCLHRVAKIEGMDVVIDRDVLLHRLIAEGENVYRPIRRMFALSDLRQVAAHRKEFKDFVPSALSRFSIDMADVRGAWGLTLDSIYDQIIDEISNAAARCRRN